MNNHELYATLRKEIGNTRTVYYRDILCGGESYTSARIMEFEYNYVTDELRVKLLLARTQRTGLYDPPMDNVSVADLYLPSPINSRHHGDMVPVRTYFELLEREQGSNGAYFNYRYTPETKIPAKDFKEILEKNSIGRLSFDFSKKDTKFEYNKIIFSGPCTIIIWKDGTKTIARVSEGDTFDPEKGVAICFMKRMLGHTETNKILKVADEMWELLQAEFADVDIKQAIINGTPLDKEVEQEPTHYPKFRDQQEKHRVFHTITAIEKVLLVIGNDDVIDDISILKELVRKIEVEE